LRILVRHSELIKLGAAGAGKTGLKDLAKIQIHKHLNSSTNICEY
jgi:hypothetical protein